MEIVIEISVPDGVFDKKTYGLQLKTDGLYLLFAEKQASLPQIKTERKTTVSAANSGTFQSQTPPKKFKPIIRSFCGVTSKRAATIRAQV